MKKFLTVICALIISATCLTGLAACKQPADGAAFLTGVTAPDSSVGKVGDMYLDSKSYDLYTRAEDGWKFVCNIKGADGKDGTNGKDGEDGKDGVNGASIENVMLNADGDVIIIFADGNQANFGKVPVPETLYYAEIIEGDRVVGYGIRDLGTVSSSKLVIPSAYMGKPVTAIMESAFFNCKHITSVVIPDTVKYIEDSAFYSCENLTSLDLGSGVQTIGETAFAYCESLSEVHLPASLKSVGDDAFAGCTSLEKATAEEGVEFFGMSVFSGCSLLKEFIMPDSVLSYGFGMFMGCASLEKVKLSESATLVSQHTFSDCYSLSEVTIGSKTKTIGYSAFYNNHNLVSIVIPATVKEIETYAFYKLPAFRFVYFGGTEAEWEAIKVGRSESTTVPLSFALTASQSNTEKLFGEDVTVYFYSETRPTTDGYFWRYVNGKPGIW